MEGQENKKELPEFLKERLEGKTGGKEQAIADFRVAQSELFQEITRRESEIANLEQKRKTSLRGNKPNYTNWLEQGHEIELKKMEKDSLVELMKIRFGNEYSPLTVNMEEYDLSQFEL